MLLLRMVLFVTLVKLIAMLVIPEPFVMFIKQFLMVTLLTFSARIAWVLFEPPVFQVIVLPAQSSTMLFTLRRSALPVQLSAVVRFIDRFTSVPQPTAVSTAVYVLNLVTLNMNCKLPLAL